MRVEVREDARTHTHTHTHTQHSKRGQVGGRGRECVSERCTRWVSRMEKHGLYISVPPFLGLLATLVDVESFGGRGERGRERERARARARWRQREVGWGGGVGRERFRHIFVFLFFFGCKLLDRSWYRRHGEVSGKRAQDTGADPAIGLITRQTH